MLQVSAIVCVSSSYSGLFQKTGLLDGCKRVVSGMAKRIGRYPATLLTSIPAGMVACNQTLAILLTDQLCREEYADSSALALDLEDTAAITSPLIRTRFFTSSTAILPGVWPGRCMIRSSRSPRSRTSPSRTGRTVPGFPERR